MQKLVLFVAACLIISRAEAQRHSDIKLKTATGTVFGTLTLPNTLKAPVPVVLIIAGSGPTDRDGNNSMMKNNSLLQVGDSLARHGIASVRYDKRGIAASKAAAPDESSLRFNDYVGDASGWLRLLAKDKRFSQRYVFGHSEGSLIGMLALQKTPADGFISVAGAGAPADVILIKQLRSAPSMHPGTLDTVAHLLKMLKTEGKISDVPPQPFYQAFFRSSVQGYFASWMKHDPAVEIALVKAPVLILQGTADIQVDTAQAALLASAKPDAQLKFITGMNHIFKEASLDDIAANTATYYEAETPIMKALVDEVTAFINKTKRKPASAHR